MSYKLDANKNCNVDSNKALFGGDLEDYASTATLLDR